MSPTAPSFAEATAVKEVPGHSHRYSAYFRDEFCVGSVPHGGYITSIFIEVARRHFSTTLKHLDQPDTMTMHLSFLRRASEGPALFIVRDAKTGRQTSTLQVSLFQGHDETGDVSKSREEVVAYMTHTNFENEKGRSLETGWTLQPPVSALPELSKLETDSDPNWALLRNLPFEKFRKATTRARWFFPRKRARGVVGIDTIQGFSTRLPAPAGSGADFVYERCKTPALGFFADLFPQIIEDTLAPDTYQVDPPITKKRGKDDIGAAFWYPTVVLNLEIKERLPAEGLQYLYQRVQAKQIANGRYDLEVVIMDKPDGHILALSHHTVLLMKAERNTGGRAKSAGSKSEKQPSKL